jgi:hypothetical protein
MVCALAKDEGAGHAVRMAKHSRMRTVLGVCVALCSVTGACTDDEGKCGGNMPAPNVMMDASQTPSPDPIQNHDTSTQDSGTEDPLVTPHDAATSDASTDGHDASSIEDASVMLDAGDGCIDGTIRWTSNGGLVAWRRAFSVEPCRSFIAEQDNFDDDVDRLCENELPVDHGITADSIDALVAHPDVQAAIAAAPVLYGTDPRPVDGTVNQIDVAGAEILVGGQCTGSSTTCNTIPPGVVALAAIIDDLIEQQESEVPNCVVTN